jgi:AcrR family transcriptional regulator
VASATSTRRRLPRVEREARMLDAAEAAFADQGFAGASMDAIAADSGITKALLYQYFGSKEGLYTACVERRRRELFDRLAELARAADGPVERLRTLVELWFEELQASRSSPVLLYGDAPRAAVDEMRGRNAETIAEILRIDYPDAGPDALAMTAHLVVGAGEQVGRWWAARPDVPVEQVRERFVRAVGMAVDAGLR